MRGTLRQREASRKNNPRERGGRLREIILSEGSRARSRDKARNILAARRLLNVPRSYLTFMICIYARDSGSPLLRHGRLLPFLQFRLERRALGTCPARRGTLGYQDDCVVPASNLKFVLSVGSRYFSYRPNRPRRGRKVIQGRRGIPFLPSTK